MANLGNNIYYLYKNKLRTLSVAIIKMSVCPHRFLLIKIKFFPILKTENLLKFYETLFIVI